jgi:hypothetical protein
MPVSKKLKTVDDFIIEISSLINTLDTKNPQTKNYKNKIDKIYDILIKRKKFGLDQDIWSELHFLSVYMYPYVKTIGNIPCTMVTKHNHILPFYMMQNIDKENTTILHFDTHPDMNPVKNNDKLPELYEIFKKTNNLNIIDKCQEIVWDIGAAISGVFFTTGIQNYIWCTPSWIPDKNINSQFFIRKNKNELILSTNDNKLYDDPLVDVNYTSKIENNTRKYCKFQTMESNNKTNLKNLIDIIGNSKKYILDIDLDYFVCNGVKLNLSEYMKDPYDVASYYRTKTIIINENSPRNMYDKSDVLSQYEKDLKKEIVMINKRIKKFLNLIYSLKRKNYIPTQISICDSTNLSFSLCKKCNSISNGYMPKNLAYYVHNEIFTGLENIFSS